MKYLLIIFLTLISYSIFGQCKIKPVGKRILKTCKSNSCPDLTVGTIPTLLINRPALLIAAGFAKDNRKNYLQIGFNRKIATTKQFDVLSTSPIKFYGSNNDTLVINPIDKFNGKLYGGGWWGVLVYYELSNEDLEFLANQQIVEFSIAVKAKNGFITGGIAIEGGKWEKDDQGNSVYHVKIPEKKINKMSERAACFLAKK